MTAPTRNNAGRVPFGIDDGSFRENVERTAVFGSIDTEHGRGQTALPANATNGRARDCLVSHLEAVGLDIRIDAVDNITGRWTPGDVDPDAAPVAAGSHLDSVPNGGIFDGPLGVYATVEAVRSVHENGLTPVRLLEVVCFTGKEGARFADGVLGSTVTAGRRGVDETFALMDGGVTLENALDRVGYRGSSHLDVSAWDVWVELHTEQNTRLGDVGVPLSIVTGIIGTVWCHVSIEGQADHSGATEMTARHDVLVATSKLVLEVGRHTAGIATTGSGTTISTIGELDVEPDIVNVVPGATSLRLDLWSVDHEEVRLQLDAVERALDAVETHHGVTTSFDYAYNVLSTSLSERCRRVATEASRMCNIKTLSLYSGAGHNTMQVADMTDAALVFIASENGHSHSPREQADWADCTTTTEMLTRMLARLATTDDTKTDDIERN